jgi:hypothetical protein
MRFRQPGKRETSRIDFVGTYRPSPGGPSDLWIGVMVVIVAALLGTLFLPWAASLFP